MGAHAIAVIPLAIWIYLILGRGGFWRVPAIAPPAPPGAPACRVIAVVPARNEAPLIGRAVRSLLQQQFAGTIQVIVVDDGSSDGTAAAARAAGDPSQVTVIRGSDVPRGWTGKLWALAQGVAATEGRGADYLLLTDADIEHAPQELATLIAGAEAGECDLVSHMVRLSTATPAERFLIPAFVFFFFKIYPPAWIASPRRRLAAAAGGCILIRPQALARIGGLEPIRSRIIDDCALARAVKDSGGRISLQLARDTRSLRVYGSMAEIGAMVARTAFAQLDHSYLAVAGTVLGMFVTYLLPLLLLASGDGLQSVLGLGALLLMSLCYLPMIRFYDLPAAWCVCLPAAALFYVGAVIRSAIDYSRGTGGRWKGRAQDT